MKPEPQSRALSLYIVAAEESGDALGAALVRALNARHGGALTLNGVGGRAMAAAGVNSPFAIDELSIMGIAAIPRRLPMIFRRIRQTAAAVVAARPDALVIVDSPDFTHRVARRVRQIAPSIPILDYVSPSIWAWRPGRARAMRAYVDQVLAILPFEPALYVKLGGPPCRYVGHPLIERIAELRPNAEEAQRRRADPPVVLVLPTVPHLAAQVLAAVAGWKVAPRVVVDPAEKWAAFRRARAALAASGTVTLELALAGIPTVAAYRMSPLEAFIVVWLLRVLVRLPSVILANLVLGENVIPELLQSAATPERLAAALLPLLSDTPQRQRQIEAFGRLDGIMAIGGEAPSAKAAVIVLDVAQRHAERDPAALSAPSQPC